MEWRPFSTIPRDGRALAVFTDTGFLPELRCVHYDGEGWRYRPHTTWSHVHPRVLGGNQFSRGAPVAVWGDAPALPGPVDHEVADWLPMDSAPHDGSPFWWFSWTHCVGGRVDYYEPRLSMIYRDRCSPESDGCWSSIVTSVSDVSARRGWWSTTALPLDPMRQFARLMAYYMRKRQRREAFAAEKAVA